MKRTTDVNLADATIHDIAAEVSERFPNWKVISQRVLDDLRTDHAELMKLRRKWSVDRAGEQLEAHLRILKTEGFEVDDDISLSCADEPDRVYVIGGI